MCVVFVFFFKQKTAYEMRISDWSSDVCSSDLEGCLLNAPDVYMDKLAVGPGYSPGIIDLNKSVRENVEAVAREKGVDASEIIVCVLDRPRHEKLIGDLREIGCGIMLIPDGDVAGVIATTDPDTTIDMYMGSGGAPEGVLAAAALRCVGGQFKDRKSTRLNSSH